MDERFFKINKLLSQYSLGNFDKKLAISSRMDEVDAFISGVNMLGEELKVKTISRDYFNNIFDSVSDMVFVVDKQGKIEDINDSVIQHLQYDKSFLTGKPIDQLAEKPEKGCFNALVREIRTAGLANCETQYKTAAGKVIPVLVSASFLNTGKNPKRKILLTARDISFQKESQNKILKAIIETEENERTRFARDIHDSIGQQLSAIKFYIGTSVQVTEDPKQKEILLKANAALLEVQADMRNICFNIMPTSLEKFGLVKAVEELCLKNELLGKIKIRIKEAGSFPVLPAAQASALFRIIQEFINNSLKHSRATQLQIGFSSKNKTAFIRLTDNGIGFDMAKLRNKGMGLNNVLSRIKPYDGEVSIASRPGKGTRYDISIPIATKK